MQTLYKMGLRRERRTAFVFIAFYKLQFCNLYSWERNTSMVLYWLSFTHCSCVSKMQCLKPSTIAAIGVYRLHLPKSTTWLALNWDILKVDDLKLEIS